MSTEQNHTLSPKQKALKINLDSSIYGTFSEIGAGQEVVRHFFRAGGASGTIAKAMSAYDKEFSDAIYGKEGNGRYVCKSRLKKMLLHEYRLIKERLDRNIHPDKKFFCFANTIATIDFRKTSKGHGWMGMRFQLEPDKEPNSIILHVKLHDLEAMAQQEVVGLMGVNLLYGCYNHADNPEKLIDQLYDNLDRDRIELDMVEFSGPDFEDTDNRLMALYLVRTGKTDAIIFGPNGKPLHPSDILYKKHILTIRGSFRPITHVQIDMIKNGYSEFIKDPKVDKDKVVELVELTMSNLTGEEGKVNAQDFLDRAEILCGLGQTVLVSNFQLYYKLVEYLTNYSRKRMGLILGANNMVEVFNPKYYLGLNGGVLEAFGYLFSRDLKVYLYPFKSRKTGELINSKHLPIHPRTEPLFNYLSDNKRIIDLQNYNPDILDIYPKQVLAMIKDGAEGWETKVPAYVANMIKEKKLFGYQGAKTHESA